MFASDVEIEEQLEKYTGSYNDDRCSLLELIRFLGKHPYTRYSRAAIVLAFRHQGVFVERGLKYLVANGIATLESENKINLYSLTSCEEIRNWVLHLVKLDWCQWQSVLKEIRQEQECYILGLEKAREN
jgi:hypothetical protein